MTDRQAADRGPNVTASGAGSIAVGGDAYAPLTTNVHIAAPRPPVEWPVQVGVVPPLATAFQPRTSVMDQIRTARREVQDVILRQASSGTRVLSGAGGVGKSQLAASLTKDEGVDLVIWVDASTPTQIVAAYAAAAARVQVPGADGTDPERDARLLLDWLATTDRTWLVILDDVTDPLDLSTWWPPDRTVGGWTVATTRRRDAALTGAGRAVIDVDVYTATEARNYLTSRLAGANSGHLLDTSIDELAVELGLLPLALSHAAAYIIDEAVSTDGYLRLYRDGRQRLPQLLPKSADADGYGKPVAVTLLLALERAEANNSLARRCLELVALVDPAGHPEALWQTSAIIDYLSAGSSASDPPVTAERARQTLTLLHRYALIDYVGRPGPRAVRIHALTARATREATSSLDPAVYAAADALVECWPEIDHATTDDTTALRANTAVLAGITGDLLWHPDGHPVLFRAGISLLNAGLHATAVGYWHGMSRDAERALGPDHPDTLTAHGDLALAYIKAGRAADAIALGKQVCADSERVLGPDHPSTLAARANVARAYRDAGRTTEAIVLGKRVCADSERVLGSDHRDALRARNNLAASYHQAGRTMR